LVWRRANRGRWIGPTSAGPRAAVRGEADG